MLTNQKAIIEEVLFQLGRQNKSDISKEIKALMKYSGAFSRTCKINSKEISTAKFKVFKNECGTMLHINFGADYSKHAVFVLGSDLHESCFYTKKDNLIIKESVDNCFELITNNNKLCYNQYCVAVA